MVVCGINQNLREDAKITSQTDTQILDDEEDYDSVVLHSFKSNHTCILFLNFHRSNTANPRHYYYPPAFPHPPAECSYLCSRGLATTYRIRLVP